MRQTIGNAKRIRDSILEKVYINTDFKRTGAVKLPDDIKDKIDRIWQIIWQDNEKYFEKKLLKLKQQTNLNIEEIKLLFNQALERLFLMFYRSVGNNQVEFVRKFPERNIKKANYRFAV